MSEPSVSVTEIGRRFLYCASLAVLLFGAYTRSHPFMWYVVPGTVLTAFAMTVMGWGADRLRVFVLGQYCTMTHSMVGLAARLPFWFMGGALGYTFGVLLAKSMELLIVQDIMVADLYYYGGYLGVAAEGVLYFVTRRGRAPGYIPQGRG